MKQIKVNAAYNTLRKLADLQLPVRSAYEVYMLIKQIEPIRNFGTERGKAILEKYNGSIKGDGRLMFPTQDEANAFSNELQELNEMETDVEVTPITLSFDDLDCTLSPADIASLEGFVAFTD